MKQRWFFLLSLVLAVALLTFMICQQLPQTVLIMDKANKPGLPSNFRMTLGPMQVNLSPTPDLWGLAALNASGSSQFSEQGLQSIKAVIGNRFPIIVVDLRQESHGFVNGGAVSWYGKNNEANQGLSKREVLIDEARKLFRLGQAKEAIIADKSAKSAKPPLRVPAPFTVNSEAQLCRTMGLNYYRIPVTDHHRPTDAAVDDFIQLVNSLPKGTWLHFHCRAGVGRTTIFMEMYDMMRNARYVSYADIIRRQVALGGPSVIRNYTQKNPRSKNTLAIDQFLEQFYCYCQTNRDHFRTSWQQWLEIRGANFLGISG